MPSLKLRTLGLAAAITTFLATSLVAVPAARADDPTPPTVPGVPTFSQVTQFSVTLTWTPSTDNVGVTNYLIQRALPFGGTWGESTAGNVTTITIRDLTPNNNYTFTIIATDALGNWSAPTAPASVRTLAYTAGSMCSVSYQPLSTGTGTFFSQVAMTNLTPGAWQEWTLGFTLTPEQRVDPAWGFRQDGNRYTITFLWLWTSAAGPLLPGATRSVSFAGTFTGPNNPPPTQFTINDHPCVVPGETRPPGPPVNLTASSVTPGAVSLTWGAATPGTNPIQGYEVFAGGSRVICVGVNPLSCNISGLSPGSVYTFSVRAVDITGLAGLMVAITVQTPTSIPPSPPGNLTVSNVTDTSATLTWTASTPGSAPISSYVIYRLDAVAETPIRVVPNVTTTTLTGLTPGTIYQMRVRARDTLNVLSGPSRTVLFTTLNPPGTCTVTYSVSDWGNGSGFTGNVTIANNSTTAVTGWSLRFSFSAAGQRVQHGWSANWTQATGSAEVTATNLDWNATIPPGASVSIGFNGAYSGSNPEPGAFALNGNPCVVA